jgi:multiple sugar transport system permease protein
MAEAGSAAGTAGGARPEDRAPDGALEPAAGARSSPARSTSDRRRARRHATWRRRGLVFLFMSPWIAGFGVFFGYPLVMSAYLSLNHYDLLSAPRWVGLANYRYLFNGDPLVWPAAKNTLWLIAFMVPTQVLFAFGVAQMVARARRGVGLFRTIFYLPALAPPVAATLGFVYILNPATGPVNSVLGHLGISGPLWFNSPSWSKPSLVLLGLWGVGNTMIIFLAAIIDVPRHLHESAELDGAGPLRRLVYVTLPTISPVILFAVVIGVIDAMQYFTQAYVAADIASGSASNAAAGATNLGYPQDSTLFYPVLLYQQGFRYFNMGYASAMAVVLLAVALAFVLLIVRHSRRWVHYQGAVR